MEVHGLAPDISLGRDQVPAGGSSENSGLSIQGLCSGGGTGTDLHTGLAVTLAGREPVSAMGALPERGKEAEPRA